MSLLILTIILAAFAATSAFLEIEKSSKYYIAKNTFVAIFFIGTTIASIFQFRLSRAESIKSDKKDSAFSKSQADIILLQKINKKESDSLDNLIITLNNRLNNNTKELLKSSEKARESQNEYIKYANGSDIPEFKILSKFKKYFVVYLTNKSKYPIYNAKAQITDFDVILKNCYPVIEKNTAIYKPYCYEKYQINNDIGNIAANKSVSIEVYYEISNRHHYILDFETTNKYYKFYYIVQIKDDYLTYSVRLYEVKNDSLKFISETNEGPKYADKYWKDKFLLNLKQRFYSW